MIDFDDLDGAEDAGGEEVEAARAQATKEFEEQKRAAEEEKEERRRSAEARLWEAQRLERQRALGLEDRASAWAPLPESLWFGCSRYNPNAVVRVFCLHGVGVAGGSYTNWVSAERHGRWPAVEFVSLELPGHGTHYSAPAIEDLSELAKMLAARLAEWTRGGHDPFVIYGFSFGARLAYETAIRLGPGRRGCRKVYAACRGAPHHIAEAPASRLHDRSGCKDAAQEVPNEREALLGMLSTLVDEDTLAKYASTFGRWERMAEKGDAEFAGRMKTFRCSLLADVNFCDAPVDFAEDGSIMKFPCPLHFYHSLADEMWPLQRNWPPTKRPTEAPYDEWGWNELGAPGYKDLAASWRLYANDFVSELVPGAHGDLGSPNSAIPDRICEDLTALASAGKLL